MRTVRITSPDVRPEIEAAARWLETASEDDLRSDGPQRIRPLRDVSGVVEVVPAPPALDRLLSDAGYAVRRVLVELRRDLPLEPDLLPAAELPVRPFRPGVDDDAVLAVNNAAFAWHPEQAGWTRDDLHARMAEAWFDPTGFLLHEEDGRVVGFCWTKVHHDEEPPAGEIYVIGVDPSQHGRGLGRGLVVAGVAHLTAAGLRRILLWTESDNTRARALYASLGFEVTARHCWYERDLGVPG